MGYCDFQIIGQSKSGKTEVYEIRNVQSRSLLGIIRWHGPWRQYVYFQESNVIMSVSCLKEVQAFMESLVKMRKPE